jgi:lysophospholipase L1-like esterase
MTPHKVGAIAVMAAAIGVGLWVGIDRANTRGMSDTIIGRWDTLGGEPWLLPNLDEARVVQPDRPHSFQEVHAWRLGEDVEINRTREYSLNTNRNRLRGPALRPKRKGTTRIIAIGDSVTHGWGVTYEQSYPYQLERLLNAKGHKVDIINAGVPANPVSVMERWCTTVAPDLKPSIIIWTRRSSQQGPRPVPSYARAVRQCKRATGADIIVALPPVSTFDIKGSAIWQTERNHLAAAIGSQANAVIDLTPHFRQAQAGRGEVLEQRGGQLAVVDQETGRVWLEVPPSPTDLPKEIYALFEAEPDVREALFFDDGHPDAEGFKVFASALIPAVEALLKARAAR